MANEHAYHGTEMEIDFLTDLGHHTEHNFDRAMLLKNYIETAKYRVNWGKINMVTCVKYAQQLLEAEQ